MTAAVATDAKPPLLLVRAMNPLMRLVLRTAVGIVVRPFALLEFEGRRSGRRYRIPAGYHEIEGGRVVFSPAPWRDNFRDGRPVTVWFRGRRHAFVGTLDDDPESTAAALRSLADRRGSLRPVGIRVPSGHRVTVADVPALDRAVIRFTDAR